MKLVELDPRTLKPNPENYRAHPQEQIAEIAASLRAFGQYRNVVARPDGTILAGHGVVEAAIAEGRETIAVFVFDGTDAEARRLMVADNELSRGAEDDERALHALLNEINRDFGDLAGTGWSDAEHEARLAELAAELQELETIDFTPQLSTDQAGQGTAWNSVHGSDRVRLVFGEIEAALPDEIYVEVHDLCERAFNSGGSYADQIALILRRGCDACASD